MDIAVIGAGAFGFAMAARMGANPANHVVIWAESQQKCDEFARTHALASVLDGARLPDSVSMTSSMQQAVAGKQLVLVMPAAAFVEPVCQQMAPFLDDVTHVVIGSKGACPNGEMPAVSAQRALGREVATMGGPGFAVDIIEGVFVGLTLATSSDACYDAVARAFVHDPHIVFDRSTDMLGLELASCIKNAAAISLGALEGAGYPISSRCLLLHRIMEDLAHMLARVPGGSAGTATSLAGLGDMVLTCFSPKSRNCTYGRLVGQFGAASAQARDYLAATTVEGVTVIETWDAMARLLGIASPFMQAAQRAFGPEGSVDDLLAYMTTA